MGRTKENTSGTAKAIVGLVLLALIIVGDIISAFIGVGSPAPFANPCLTANKFCSNISFDQSIVLNTTSISLTSLSSSTFQIIQNETMLVGTHSSLGGANVTSITDTMGNSFVKIVRTGSTLTEGWMDAWIGTAGSTGADSVTVNWNVADVSFAEISVYRNVAGFGNFTSNSQQTSVVTSLSSSLITIRSGSWVEGMSGTNQAGSASLSCQALSPSSLFVQRVNSCSGTPPGAQDSMFMSDNATILRNQSTISFTSTSSNGQAISIDMIEVELTPTDTEPQNPLNICISNSASCGFCNPSGTFGYCVNSVTKVFATNSIQNIIVGTSYCTGFAMTSGITVSGGASTIEGVGIYGVQDENITGAIAWVQLEITTTVPSTTFGAGQCATGGFGGGNNKISFASSGSTLTQHGLNEFYIGISASFPTLAAGTYYGFLEVTPQSGSIKIAQWGADSQISLIQTK